MALVASTAGSILGAFYKVVSVRIAMVRGYSRTPQTLLAKDLAEFAANCVKALVCYSITVLLDSTAKFLAGITFRPCFSARGI